MCLPLQSGDTEVSTPLRHEEGIFCNERRQVIKLLITFLCIENGSATRSWVALCFLSLVSILGNVFIEGVQDILPREPGA